MLLFCGEIITNNKIMTRISGFYENMLDVEGDFEQFNKKIASRKRGTKVDYRCEIVNDRYEATARVVRIEIRGEYYVFHLADIKKMEPPALKIQRLENEIKELREYADSLREEKLLIQELIKSIDNK